MAGASVDDLGEEGFDEGGEAVGEELVAGVEGGEPVVGCGGEVRFRGLWGKGSGGRVGGEGEGGGRGRRGGQGGRSRRRRGIPIIQPDIEDGNRGRERGVVGLRGDAEVGRAQAGDDAFKGEEFCWGGGKGGRGGKEEGEGETAAGECQGGGGGGETAEELEAEGWGSDEGVGGAGKGEELGGRWG